MLCEQMDLQINEALEDPQDGSVALTVTVVDKLVSAAEVPEFMLAVVTTLYEKGLLTEADIPYKSGRVRYLIAENTIHDHGGTFRRPVDQSRGGGSNGMFVAPVEHNCLRTSPLSVRLPDVRRFSHVYYNSQTNPQYDCQLWCGDPCCL
jgi:hypothetical protein